LVIGKEFDVLTISFDHREGPKLGADKKHSLLNAFNSMPQKKQGGVTDWHFLTGDQTNIRQLTESVGYGFRWNETKNDFDHRAAIIFMSPSGKITRYLQGTYFDPRTFRLAIVESSEGTVGTALDRFLLSCYGYDPRTGTYSRIGPVVVTTGAALTVIGLFTLLFVLSRKERQRQTVPATAS
jgi:protein SCO1/2